MLAKCKGRAERRSLGGDLGREMSNTSLCISLYDGQAAWRDDVRAMPVLIEIVESMLPANTGCVCMCV